MPECLIFGTGNYFLDSISCQEVSRACCKCDFRMIYADMKLMDVLLFVKRNGVSLNESVVVYTCKVNSLVCRPFYLFIVV